MGVSSETQLGFMGHSRGLLSGRHPASFCSCGRREVPPPWPEASRCRTEPEPPVLGEAGRSCCHAALFGSVGPASCRFHLSLLNPGNPHLVSWSPRGVVNGAPAELAFPPPPASLGLPAAPPEFLQERFAPTALNC